jgi:hypothetical protein
MLGDNYQWKDLGQRFGKKADAARKQFEAVISRLRDSAGETVTTH